MKKSSDITSDDGASLKFEIQAVFFDIGGVLLSIDWRRTLTSLGITDPTRQLKLAHSFQEWPLHHDYERGKVSTDSFLEECKEFFSVDAGREALESAWHDLIIGPVPGVDSVLSKYSGQVPFHTLSNTNELHFNRFSKGKVFYHFDQLFTSFGLGERKPDAAIYERACEETGLHPSQCLFLDDTEDNITAARAAGWNAELSRDSSQRTAEILEKYL